MKKSFYFLCLIIMIMFVGMINVKGASLSVNADKINASTSARDYTFTLNFSGTTNNEWKLSYDNEIYPVGTNPIANGKLSSDSGSITFAVRKGLNLVQDKVVNITVQNINNTGDIATASITILKNQNPTTTTTTKPPTTTTTTQAPKSNNANLKTLEIKGNDDSDVALTPNFSGDVYEYSATVDASIKTVAINATMEDSKSTMIISNNATEELIAGENNKITITVTAEDGTKKAYVINIKREALAADATLKSLSIKECSDFVFNPEKFSYTVKVKETVNKLTIEYVTSSEDALVNISGNENLKDGSKVKILVTAEDGTKKEYILNITKQTKNKVENTSSIANVNIEKNPLIIMGLSMVAFGLIGGIIYVIKK